MFEKNNDRCLIIAVIIGFVFSVIAYYLLNDFQAAIITIFIVFILVMFYFYTKKCPKCGNLNALEYSTTKTLGTKTKSEYFTQDVVVGYTVRRNRYGDVIGEDEHYEPRDYVKEIKTKTLEDYHRCKFCGYLKTSIRDETSSEIYED